MGQSYRRIGVLFIPVAGAASALARPCIVRMAHQTTLRAGTAPAVAPTDRPDALADRSFLWRLGLFYVALSLVLVLALDRFWSANWDAITFLEAARTFWDGGSPFDLYQKSVAMRAWPYAYPPLFALVLAPFVWLADALTGGAGDGWPQLLALRVPILLADVAVAVQLHRLLRRETGERWIARLGAALWLFSPVLFYHSAVQAHLESLWLWPTLVAYTWLQERQGEQVGWPMLLLVLAVAVKQSALLYAIPLGLWLLGARRWGDVARFAALFMVVFGGLALPFALHSADFRHTVVDYVAQMPVQVQSWQVWTLALEAFRLEQTRTTFPTVRFAPWLVMVASGLVALWGFRRERSWYALGLGVTLATLLLTHKAMGYHYPMLLPWLIAFALRLRRFALAGATLLWATWVLLSPYFAPWADPAHLPLYATLGTLNSLVWAGLLWQALRGDEAPQRESPRGALKDGVRLTRWMVLLATAFVLACLAHPLRVALLGALGGATPAVRWAALALLLAMLILTSLALFRPLAAWAERALALPLAEQRRVRPTRAHALAALLFVPLCFTWFTMNAEVTSVIEHGLAEAWNVEGIKK